MNKKYVSPTSMVFSYQTEHGILLTSPNLKDEMGGDQLSNERSGWDNPEWISEED